MERSNNEVDNMPHAGEGTAEEEGQEVSLDDDLLADHEEMDRQDREIAGAAPAAAATGANAATIIDPDPNVDDVVQQNEVMDDNALGDPILAPLPERRRTMKEQLVDRERQARVETERARLKRQFALSHRMMTSDDERQNDNERSGHDNEDQLQHQLLGDDSVVGTVGSSVAGGVGDVDQQSAAGGDATSNAALGYAMERFLLEQQSSQGMEVAMVPPPTAKEPEESVVMERFLNAPVVLDAPDVVTEAVEHEDSVSNIDGLLPSNDIPPDHLLPEQSDTTASAMLDRALPMHTSTVALTSGSVRSFSPPIPDHPDGDVPEFVNQHQDPSQQAPVIVDLVDEAGEPFLVDNVVDNVVDTSAVVNVPQDSPSQASGLSDLTSEHHATRRPLTAQDIQEMAAIEEASIGNEPPSERALSEVGDLVNHFADEGMPAPPPGFSVQTQTTMTGTTMTPEDDDDVVGGGVVVASTMMNGMVRSSEGQVHEDDHVADVPQPPPEVVHDEIDAIATASVSSHMNLSPVVSDDEASVISVTANPPSVMEEDQALLIDDVVDHHEGDGVEVIAAHVPVDRHLSDVSADDIMMNSHDHDRPLQSNRNRAIAPDTPDQLKQKLVMPVNLEDFDYDSRFDLSKNNSKNNNTGNDSADWDRDIVDHQPSIMIASTGVGAAAATAAPLSPVRLKDAPPAAIPDKNDPSFESATSNHHLGQPYQINYGTAESAHRAYVAQESTTSTMTTPSQKINTRSSSGTVIRSERGGIYSRDEEGQPLLPIPNEVSDEQPSRHRRGSLRSLADAAELAESVFSSIRSDSTMSIQEEANEADKYMESTTLTRAFPERFIALFVTLLVEIPVLLMISGGSDRLCYLIGRRRYQLMMGFLPLSSAISGNCGLQASTLTTRAISHHHVTTGNYGKWFRTEVGAALYLGLGMGCVLGLYAFFVSGMDGPFGLTIFCAQFVAVLTAGCTGTLAPLLFTFIFRRDSGKWGGPLETAIQDIVGSFAMVIMSYRLLLLFGPAEVDPNDVCGAIDI